jgi:hypothetical protein
MRKLPPGDYARRASSLRGEGAADVDPMVRALGSPQSQSGIPTRLRDVFVAVVAATSLASCSIGVGSGPARGLAAAERQPAVRRSLVPQKLTVPNVLPDRIVQRIRPAPPENGPGWMSPEAVRARGLLYVSSYYCNCVRVYNLEGNHQRPIGIITKTLVGPEGLTTDQHGRIWVANTGASNIEVFRRGAITPSLVLDDPGEYPVDIATYSDGSVYAANIISTSGGPGNVVYYAKGARQPSGTLNDPNWVPGTRLLGIALSTHKDVFVSFLSLNDGSSHVDYFPAGSTIPVKTGIVTAQAIGILIDNSGDVVVADAVAPAVDVFSGSGSSWKLNRQFGMIGQPNFLALGDARDIFVTDPAAGVVHQYVYATGVEINTIRSGWGASDPPFGVAASPTDSGL